jgi:hypothetical protein
LPLPTPSPIATATVGPSADTSVTLSATAPIPLPAVSGFTETLDLTHAVPAGTTGSVNVAVSTTVPAGLPAPQALRRTQSASLPQGLIFITLGPFASAQAWSAYPGFTITATSTIPTGTYYVEASGVNGWQYVGPATASGTTVTFTGPVVPVSIPSGDSLTLALVVSNASGTVTVTPAGAVPSPFAPGSTLTLNASETNYSGAFTATSSNTGVATVAAGATSGSFVVTATGPGTAQITVSDFAENYGTYSVTVVQSTPGASGIVVLTPATTSAGPDTIAAGATVVVQASESNYTGTFSATSTNTSVASVPSGPVASGTFTVTAIRAGSTTIVVADTANHTATFYLVVTAAPSGLNSVMISLPSQNFAAVALPASSLDDNISAGTITYSFDPPVPTGTLTVVLTNAPPTTGFPSTLPGGSSSTPVLSMLVTSSVALSIYQFPFYTFTINPNGPNVGLLNPLSGYDLYCAVYAVAGSTSWTQTIGPSENGSPGEFQSSAYAALANPLPAQTGVLLSIFNDTDNVGGTPTCN